VKGLWATDWATRTPQLCRNSPVDTCRMETGRIEALHDCARPRRGDTWEPYLPAGVDADGGGREGDRCLFANR
jgi:hypothetical protein